MPNLILPSLEIQNFRAFEHLRIERLGRVNLITGKNNVGKTSLLEALYLYARGGSPYQLLEILDMRDELPKQGRGQTTSSSSEDESLIFNFKYLFHGRIPIIEQTKPIKIGRVDSDKETLTLTLSMRPLPLFETTTITQSHPIPIDEAEGEVADQNNQDGGVAPYCTVRTRLGGRYSYWLERILDRNYNIHLTSSDTIISPFIKAPGWPDLAFNQLWDKIALTPQEDDVLDALRIIVPDVKRISFIGEENGRNRRIPIIRLGSITEPIPLRSLGEGMNRLFGIALALTTAKDGILLVDEIETGLHYSVMPDVWRLIFQVAERLNVQVFATTHSWDCIEAFERAAREDEDANGELIHLMNTEGKVFAVLYDEKELGIVTEEMIEVR